MLLNSPHNPTGTVLTRAELPAVADVAIEHDLVVITDEVYEHLAFDGHDARADRDAAGHGRAHPDPVQRRQVLLVHRLEGRLGDRPGRAGAARAGGQAVADVHLRLAAPARRRPRAGRRARLPARRSPPTCRSGATCCAPAWPRSGSTCGCPEGTYFATTDVATSAGRTALAFCLALPERAGVVAIPTQVFYDDPDAGRHLVRWAFCKERRVIEEGLAPAGGCAGYADLASSLRSGLRIGRRSLALDHSSAPPVKSRR